jgi:hypothetical protein
LANCRKQPDGDQSAFHADSELGVFRFRHPHDGFPLMPIALRGTINPSGKMKLGEQSTLGSCVSNEARPHVGARQVFSTIFLTQI